MLLQFEPSPGTSDEILLIFGLGVLVFVIIGIVLVEISFRLRQKRYHQMSDDELKHELQRQLNKDQKKKK